MGQLFGGILRAVCTIGNTGMSLVVAGLLAGLVLAPRPASGQQRETVEKASSQLTRFIWDFSRASDRDADQWPDQWKRFRGIGYPDYVDIEIAPHEPELEARFRALDQKMLLGWDALRANYPGMPPLPPSMADAMIDRYLRIEMDGGQAGMQSPPMEASRVYKYRFSCRVMTQGLRHDTARAELVFLDDQGKRIESHWTAPVGGSTDGWMHLLMDLVRPPVGAASMLVQLHVQRSASGMEDIRGVVGFDDIRIEQYPQIQVATDQSLGVYRVGDTIDATARVMGLAADESQVRFVVLDQDGEMVATQLMTLRRKQETETDDALDQPLLTTNSAAALPNDLLSVDGRTDVSLGMRRALQEEASQQEDPEIGMSVRWRLPMLQPGFYRIKASLVGESVSTLATETTVAVIDTLIDRVSTGAFGWTLPDGLQDIPPREAAAWLAALGVSWVKYPCWLPSDDYEGAEQLATLLSKMQDVGIQTIGVLDHPPESQASLFSERGRRNLVAAELFKDTQTWQPMLEPVMSRLSLKVRVWQLGADRDHSFLGQTRLRESIAQISTGLQGFGQPIDVAISWPWLERQLPRGEASWQAVSRSSEPPLGPRELDSFLKLASQNDRGDGPRTWLLIDPISRKQYDREARMRDLVLRMATVRSHRVQAAFVSNPHHEERGLLRSDGRPEELLLPWRTTSRLLGDLRKAGSLQMRSGAENMVFMNDERAVLVVWSAEPTEESIYLGEDVKEVDVWGRVRDLPSETHDDQVTQRLQIGPVPRFIIGADPVLLQFRMSVDVTPESLDSFLGQKQQLTVRFENPTRDSMVGQMQIVQPSTWSIDNPLRGWEMLAGRASSYDFDVILGNTSKIGQYEVPIRFLLETIPPKLVTVYRKVDVGPDGLDLNVTTRLLANNQMRVRIEITNRSEREQSYDCMLFPSGNRQYKRRFITIRPGETQKREIYWTNGRELVGTRMLLRADEEDGPRLLNYPIEVTR